ncbi:aminotransferase class V-fold PLP-dependent enzyme [Rhodococcus sp. NPDC003318]|uniref:aminotransferase class V-fold PLP-dependent enzyme n=1 Tax=Rhodococcus sp. NPDC003318 TaxID=3364503 RepID=UPI00369891DE
MTAVLDTTIALDAAVDESCATAGPFASVCGSDLVAPLADGTSVTYANFDYAASAPALSAVAEAVQSLLPFYASVHRGAGFASQVCTERYEGARDVVADFVGARTDDVVVFTRNTTDALNLLASCVPGDTVVLDIEHHANLLPWKRNGARVVRSADTVEETVQRLVAELCTRPAALLAVTGASNVTGEVLPIARLARIAHECGARIAVDAAQLLPHRRVDIADLDVDYLVFSGHKLYAPFGAGALVGRADWLDVAEPYLAGGGATKNVDLDGIEWATAPQRHEAGSPNVLGAVAIAAACQALAAFDADAAQRHERALCARLVAGLSDVDGVDVLRIWPDSPDAVGIVTFTVAGAAPREVATYLSDLHGIGVRDGRFCAHPLLSRLGHGDGAVRASLGLGSSSADVDRLIAAVGEFVRGRATDAAAAR